ncbi:YopX family protein [Streptococcus sp. ZY19097]|uniref:YopX family protein n=1 Tax=Streptococcus sp. ZY19097 TaxID=3231906 RepID=UPI0034593ABA
MIPKFRAWDVHNMEMFTNAQLIIWNGNVYANDPGKISVDKMRGWSIDEKYLMQSTGLLDKNGVEIFEGDVVKCYIVTEKDECEYVGVVCFKDFSFVIVDEKDTYDPLWNYKSGFVDIETEIEIIGNIYKNPELMEG